MTIPGVDYSSGHPGGSALKAAGKAFAARYVSHTPSKNISAAEATDLASHGVSTVLVWETTANRAMAGRTAGIADAHDALTQATAAGMPGGRPIYFAVDWNATEAQQPAINAYFQGVASVLGLDRTAGYGGYWVIKRLLDAGLIRFTWQTAAWSGGQWDPRAAIRQGAQARINGVDCDLNTATVADYGQWMPGQTPITPQEDDVELTDKITIKKGTWSKTDQTATVAEWIGIGNLKAEAAEVAATKALAAVVDLADKIGNVTLTDQQVINLSVQITTSPQFPDALAAALVKLAAHVKS